MVKCLLIIRLLVCVHLELKIIPLSLTLCECSEFEFILGCILDRGELYDLNEKRYFEIHENQADNDLRYEGIANVSGMRRPLMYMMYVCLWRSVNGQVSWGGIVYPAK